MKRNIEDADAWGRLCEFLDADDEGARQDRLHAAAEMGTDLEKLAARLRLTARQAMQERIRAESISQRHAARPVAEILNDIASWPAEKLRTWLESVRGGSLGEEAVLLVEPCFRNRNQEDATEEELRTQVADIMKALAKSDR